MGRRKWAGSCRQITTWHPIRGEATEEAESMYHPKSVRGNREERERSCTVVAWAAKRMVGATTQSINHTDRSR